MKNRLLKLPELISIVVVVWLIVLSVSISQTHSKLTVLKNETHTESFNEFEKLEASLQSIILRLQQIETQPVSVSETQFTATQAENNKEFERIQSRFGHLTTLFESLSSSTQENDLNDLRQRLEQLEAARDAARQKTPDESKPSDRRSTTAAPKPMTLTPPFKILGTEIRGQEPLLVIAFTAQPKTIRLLRIGDAIDQWALTAIEPHQARFRINNRTVNLALPK